MKTSVRLALLSASILCGTAAADTFAIDRLPLESAPPQVPLSSPPGKTYLAPAELPLNFAAGRSLDHERDGYIGTIHDLDTYTLETSVPGGVAVPEPATLTLLGSGLALAAFRRFRRA